jgi:hypothetical protein
MGFRNTQKRCIHVLGHPTRITANIEMRSLLQPRPQICSLFQHAVLYVNLFDLIK